MTGAPHFHEPLPFPPSPFPALASSFQPIFQSRNPSGQVFGVSCGEKCDYASQKHSKRPAMQEKVRLCELFAAQNSHNRTFLCIGGAFFGIERIARAEPSRRDPFRSRPYRWTLQMASRTCPADGAHERAPWMGHTDRPRECTYGWAFRKREGKWVRWCLRTCSRKAMWRGRCSGFKAADLCPALRATPRSSSAH